MATALPSPAHSFQVDAGFARMGFERVHLPVLERGVVPSDTDLFRWLVDTSGSLRRDVVVTLLDASHVPVLRWTLRQCFPVALEWSVLDAAHSTVLVERLRLAVDSVDLAAA